MPAAPAAPPPAPAKTTPAPAAPIPKQDQPTKIDPPSGHEPTLETYLGEDMAELTEMEATPQPEPRPRGEDGKFQKPTEAPKKPQDKPEPEKAVEAPTEPEKPVEEPKPGTMRALGKAYDELKSERDKVLHPKIQSLESKVKEYESRLEQMAKAQPDVKPYEEKLAALQKQNQELLESVRFADYSQSPEFKQKYVVPYEEAWSEAMAELGDIAVTTQDGGTRKFNANDLLSLANASVDKSDEIIEQSFPRATTQQRVIGHVNEIRKLAKAQEKALAEAKKGAGEYQTKQTEAQKAANLAFTQAYQGATNELTTKWSKWFAPDDTDPQGNDMLKKGYDYADSVFSPNGTNLTPEQRAGRLAVIRAKAANHDRLVAREKKHLARIAELEKSLSEFEKSEPTTETAGDPGAGTTMLDLLQQDEAELRKLDR